MKRRRYTNNNVNASDEDADEDQNERNMEKTVGAAVNTTICIRSDQKYKVH